MKLEEFKNRINEMYEKYGDINIYFDVKTGGEELYSFEKNGELVNYLKEDVTIMPDELFDYLFVEEILDIQETYDDEAMTKVSGICLSNYKQVEENK